MTQELASKCCHGILAGSPCPTWRHNSVISLPLCSMLLKVTWPSHTSSGSLVSLVITAGSRYQLVGAGYTGGLESLWGQISVAFLVVYLNMLNL